MSGRLAFAGLSICVLAAASAEEPGASSEKLRFTTGQDGEYLFNTGELSGKLRKDGRSVGLLPVVHTATGRVLTSSMGFTGHYRVFSGSRRFGEGAWYWPSQARLLDNGAVEVHWPAAEERPFDMWAVYQWTGPSMLDVESRVRPQRDLPDFESFLASYFGEEFDSASVYARDERGAKVLVSAEESHGAWQIFPRDAAAMRLIQDGRWKQPPHPVEWVTRVPFERAIGVRRSRDSGLMAVIMAAGEDCFALSTPQQTDSHRSLYLSLFGRTIRANERARARVRLVIGRSLSMEGILRLYADFGRSSVAGGAADHRRRGRYGRRSPSGRVPISSSMKTAELLARRRPPD